MKDSGIEWIGDIPEDWDISKFKNSSNLYVGDSIKDNEKDKYLDKDDAKAYVATKDLIIDENMVDFSNTLYVKNDNLKFKTAPKGSSLICIEGGSAGRKKAFLDRDVCFVNKLCCINPLNSMDKKYMFYLISNQAFEQEFDKYIQGLIGGVSINKLSNFNIPLPTLKEQHKISSFLDNEVNKINISIGYIYEQIENLKNYKKSVITEAVTKGLDKNVEMKDSEIEWIGEIPKHWEIIRLKYGLTEKMKYGASEEGVEFSETLPRYIRITDIDQNGNLKSTGKQSLPENKSVGYILEDNTVLFARSGATVGKTFLYKKEYGRSAYAGYLIAAKTNNIILLGIWLYYFTFSDAYYNWTRQMFSQSTIQNINAEKYSNMPLPITGISNQLKIIDYLNKKTKLIDDSIAIKQKQLETLEEYKKSLIYEYVTGKKEVKDGEET